MGKSFKELSSEKKNCLGLELQTPMRRCGDKSGDMERKNIVGLISKQQKLNSSTLWNPEMSMMVEEEETVMEAPRIQSKRSLLSRAARSSKSLLSNITKQVGSRSLKRRMVMGTRALEEGRRSRRLVCLCLPMKEESSLVLEMVARGAMVEQVDSDSLLLRGDLMLAVNGTLLAGMQVGEVEDLIRLDQSEIDVKQSQLLNIILWRSGCV